MPGAVGSSSSRGRRARGRRGRTAVRHGRARGRWSGRVGVARVGDRRRPMHAPERDRGDAAISTGAEAPSLGTRPRARAFGRVDGGEGGRRLVGLRGQRHAREVLDGTLHLRQVPSSPVSRRGPPRGPREARGPAQAGRGRAAVHGRALGDPVEIPLDSRGAVAPGAAGTPGRRASPARRRGGGSDRSPHPRLHLPGPRSRAAARRSGRPWRPAAPPPSGGGARGRTTGRARSGEAPDRRLGAAWSRRRARRGGARAGAARGRARRRRLRRRADAAPEVAGAGAREPRALDQQPLGLGHSAPTRARAITSWAAASRSGSSVSGAAMAARQASRGRHAAGDQARGGDEQAGARHLRQSPVPQPPQAAGERHEIGGAMPVHRRPRGRRSRSRGSGGGHRELERDEALPRARLQILEEMLVARVVGDDELEARRRRRPARRSSRSAAPGDRRSADGSPRSCPAAPRRPRRGSRSRPRARPASAGRPARRSRRPGPGSARSDRSPRDRRDRPRSRAAVRDATPCARRSGSCRSRSGP